MEIYPTHIRNPRNSPFHDLFYGFMSAIWQCCEYVQHVTSHTEITSHIFSVFNIPSDRGRCGLWCCFILSKRVPDGCWNATILIQECRTWINHNGFYYSLSLLVVTQIRGSHNRLFSPPTHYGSCRAFFFARRFSALFSLVDSRQIVLTHARRSQQLILLFLFFANK